MSSLISVRRKPQVRIDTTRLNRMQEAARQGAGTAVERIGPAAQRSREYAADRMLDARGWGAPRLERAAGYVEQDLAPRVSAFLADTAHRIEPPKPQRRARNAGLVMLATVAALGMAGAAMTRKNAEQSHSEHAAEPSPVDDGGVSSR
ncbi:hypothetical protein [Thermomonospora umbrina]|uniref:Uncharacterized protein n=1 Tax=Thermomonospora umbrina TaxID=111806 RepID=A0A3D9T0M2_9ACTN|nr:hypothetical protein [Thermomonospora umbrina]REE97371.1 hypothetical protein DFJ69_2839 [Thermomonospora umbrina]